MFPDIEQVFSKITSQKTLWYDTDERSKVYIVTAGILQGLLRNVIYNRVLAPPIPEETTVISLANLAVAKHPENVEV